MNPIESDAKETIPRRSKIAVDAALSDTRVVIISGARQVGKSTLAQQVTENIPVNKRNLDNESTRSSAFADPTTFVSSNNLLYIDEIQRAPQLFLAIKEKVDTSNRPGQFLLTGSSRLYALKDLPDSLPGRSETIELWPFSQGEIEGFTETFTEQLFSHSWNPQSYSSPIKNNKYELLQRAARGGFPEAVSRTSHDRRNRFFTSYLRDIVQRDIQQIGEIEKIESIEKLIRLLVSQASMPLSINHLAKNLYLSHKTTERYISLLEQIYLLYRIPAWSTNTTKRVTHASKLLFTDTGILASLIGKKITETTINENVYGSLLENFVLNELAKQSTWLDDPLRMFHFRDRDGREIDAVLQHPDGRIVGIEVKATATPRTEHFTSLQYLSRNVGSAWQSGIVFHTGTQTLSFGKNLWAVPIDALWTM